MEKKQTNLTGIIYTLVMGDIDIFYGLFFILILALIQANKSSRDVS